MQAKADQGQWQGKCTYWTQVCVCRDEPQEAWLELGVQWQAVVPPNLLTFTGRGCFEVLCENEVQLSTLPLAGERFSLAVFLTLIDI